MTTDQTPHVGEHEDLLAEADEHHARHVIATEWVGCDDLPCRLAAALSASRQRLAELAEHRPPAGPEEEGSRDE